MQTVQALCCKKILQVFCTNEEIDFNTIKFDEVSFVEIDEFGI